MHRTWHRALLIAGSLIGTLVCNPFYVLAETPIYRVERDGKIEYSSVPPQAGAEPAELPKLGRWKLQESAASKNTCVQHGGINCSAGPDKDGSVICFDSFADSVQRYAFECTSAKLELLSISKPDERGIFTVQVRNSKSVASQKTQVMFKPKRMEPGVKLSGPEQIEGFGVGEYSFYPSKLTQVIQEPKVAHLIVSCENCG